jgi:hypothetical protein
VGAAAAEAAAVARAAETLHVPVAAAKTIRRHRKHHVVEDYFIFTLLPSAGGGIRSRRQQDSKQASKQASKPTGQEQLKISQKFLSSFSFSQDTSRLHADAVSYTRIRIMKLAFAARIEIVSRICCGSIHGRGQ